MATNSEPNEDSEVWQFLSRGDNLASETEYEHGYKRELRRDLERYVTFRLGDERYGLPINDIVEIQKSVITTPVPRTSAFVRGIGNVRGRVMAVIDLATRLRMPSSPPTRATRLLIVNHEDELFGMVVDEVHEVISLPPEDLEDAPGGIGTTRADFIRALGRHRRNIIIILNLSTVLDRRDFVQSSFRTLSTGG